MKFALTSLATLSLLAVTCLSVSTQAGVLMVQSYEMLDGKHPATENKIYVDKDRVRIETGSNPDQYFIYRSDKKIFWTVNLKDKSYMEMTEKDLEEMFAKVDEARKKMEASMANMPPAQKEMMEKMMAKMMPAGANAPKTSYKKVGSGGTINGWSTDKYEGTREGAKQSDIWTTLPKTMDVSASDYQVMLDMAKFFEKFAKNMEGMIGDHGKNGLDGIPVKTISYKDGKASFQSEMKEVKKQNFATSLFEIPADLKKKELLKAK